MPHDRFYIDEPLIENGQVQLSDMEFHHMCHVMRLKTGDELRLRQWQKSASHSQN